MIHPNAPEVSSEAVSSWDAFESLREFMPWNQSENVVEDGSLWRKGEESLILKFSYILFSFIYNISIVQEQDNIKSTWS